MNEVAVNSLDELKSFAKDFAANLKPGDIVCMTGDLGAGKTTFVKYICEAFGIEGQVQSPTFNILLQYQNPEGILINHIDLYRLASQEELEDIGFYEAIEGEAISFVEWAEKFNDSMPSEAT